MAMSFDCYPSSSFQANEQWATQFGGDNAHHAPTFEQICSDFLVEIPTLPPSIGELGDDFPSSDDYRSEEIVCAPPSPPYFSYQDQLTMTNISPRAVHPPPVFSDLALDGFFHTQLSDPLSSYGDDPSSDYEPPTSPSHPYSEDPLSTSSPSDLDPEEPGSPILGPIDTEGTKDMPEPPDIIFCDDKRCTRFRERLTKIPHGKKCPACQRRLKLCCGICGPSVTFHASGGSRHRRTEKHIKNRRARIARLSSPY